MDEDDPRISPALGNPPGEDEVITPQSMMKRYKDNNELPYHWRYIFSFNTSQGHYRFGNDITIKIEPMAGRKKEAPIYIPILKNWQKGTKTLVYSDWYYFLAILTLASKVLWQAPHRWPTLLPFTLYFFRVWLA